jgi:Activator of Hsp90 ATPase homolog 1-like protein
MRMPDRSEIRTRVTVTFEQETAKTLVRIVQRGLSRPERRDTFEAGWGRILDRLSHKAMGDRNGQ